MNPSTASFPFTTVLLLLGVAAAAVAAAAVLPPAASHAQTLPPWQTVTSKEAGVSVLMPPGAANQPEVQSDAKTGAKLVTVTIEKESKETHSHYKMQGFRANKAWRDAARLSLTKGKDFMGVYYEVHIKPLFDTFTLAAKEEPKRFLVTRKALV